MLELENLSFSYESGGPVILDQVSLQVPAGSCMAVLGNNGAGKSTMLKCIARIFKPTGGRVVVDGSALGQLTRKELAQKLAYVAQTGEATHTMVYDAVLLGRRPYIRWDATGEDRQVVEQILQQFNLQHCAARYLDELSGGERQKVFLARAMAQQPRFLLLDEPTSNLDLRNQHEMLRLVRQLVEREQIGALIVLHDLNLALRYCDRFVFLKDAQLYAEGTEEIVTPDTIREIYGMSVDLIEHRGRKLIVPGD